MVIAQQNESQPSSPTLTHSHSRQ